MGARSRPRAVKFGGQWWIALGDVSRRYQRKRGRPLTIDQVLEVVVDEALPTG